MKNSYQQFFKAAQDAKRDPSAPKKKLSFKTKPKSQPAQKRSLGATSVESVAAEELRLRSAFKMKKKNRAPFPKGALAGLTLALVAGGFYLAAPETIESFLSKIQISAIGSAGAVEKKAEAKRKPASEKGAAEAAKPSAEPSLGAGEQAISTAEMGHFEKLKQRKDELDMREKELGELEEELQKQKAELDKRIVQLEEMRNQIAQVLKDRVEVDQEKVTKLVDLYSNMKPKQAADVIGSINEDLAVEVLAKMKKKSAAEIMNLLPSDKAKVLSEKYTGYRRSHGMDPKG